MHKRALSQASLMRFALLASAMLSSAFFCTSAVAATATAIPAPVEGEDYKVIEHPGHVTGAKVQVVEVFGFGCIHCSNLQPHLADWEKTLPAYVQFSYLPAPFGGLPDAFERAFYTAQAMHIEEKSHAGIFKAVFVDKRVATAVDVPALYADYGANPKAFAAMMQSDAVSAKVAAANDQAMHWGIEGTPTIVIDGKYRVLESSAGPDVMFHTVDWLIARQRKEHAKH